MKKLTLISIFLFSLVSFSQIKFRAYEYFEDTHDFFSNDTIKCNIIISDNSWDKEIKIIQNDDETTYKYYSAEINRPMFFKGDEKAKAKVKYDFVVNYINVVDKYNNDKCILVFKLKDKQSKKNIYLIKIQKSLHRSITYKAELIQGNYPE